MPAVHCTCGFIAHGPETACGGLTTSSILTACLSHAAEQSVHALLIQHVKYCVWCALTPRAASDTLLHACLMNVPWPELQPLCDICVVANLNTYHLLSSSWNYDMVWYCSATTKASVAGSSSLGCSLSFHT
jgi:hypothetical protein